jgi:hypothetical protein
VSCPTALGGRAQVPSQTEIEREVRTESPRVLDIRSKGRPAEMRARHRGDAAVERHAQQKVREGVAGTRYRSKRSAAVGSQLCAIDGTEPHPAPRIEIGAFLYRAHVVKVGAEGYFMFGLQPVQILVNLILVIDVSNESLVIAERGDGEMSSDVESVQKDSGNTVQSVRRGSWRPNSSQPRLLLRAL